MPSFIQKVTQKSSSNQKTPRLSIATSNDANLINANNATITTAKPLVNSPDWEVRFDPTLSVYYFVNTKTNQSQFDHPDEVVSSPLASPNMNKSDQFDNGFTDNMEHRKSTFGSALKRTLSPRFLQNTSSRIRRQSSMGGSIKTYNNSKQNNKEISYNKNEDNDDNDNDNNSSSNSEDEDVEEFKRLLELEMKNYESERLQN